MSNQLDEITTAIETEPGPYNPYLIYIPEQDDQDLSPQELASLVARSANAYARVARLAGMAHAELKKAKGRFDHKFKTSRHGKSDAERDKNGMEACKFEWEAYIQADEMATKADYLERAARVASESARKLFGQGQTMVAAQRREDTGSFQDKDFAPW